MLNVPSFLRPLWGIQILCNSKNIPLIEYSLGRISPESYYLTMSIEVIVIEYFEEWWHSLCEAEQISVAVVVELLEEKGTTLKFPQSSDIKNSKVKHLRELRIQHSGDPYRVLYAFDPRRNAILLLGGNKGGDKRWYKKHVPIAEKLYRKYLEKTESEVKE